MNRLNLYSFSLRIFNKRLPIFTSFLLVSALLFSVAIAAEPPPEYSVIAPLAPKSLLLAGSYAGERMVVVGERGHILYSDDKGESWTQARVQTLATLTGVFFHDKNLGWAVGHDAVILRTTDGGKNWSRVFAAPEEERPLLDVWFKDADYGFAIGAYGFFLTTEDGGLHWSDKMISEDDWHLNQVRQSDNGKLYIAGEAGNIYRSDDDGNTWVSLPSPYEGSFFGVLPLDGDTLLIFGLRGHLYRSEDAGENWQKINIPVGVLLNGGTRLPDGRIVIGGMGGFLFVSDDDGKNFTVRQQPDRMSIVSVLPIEKDNVLLIGDQGIKIFSLSKAR